VKWIAPKGSTGGISGLADQLEELILTAKQFKAGEHGSPNDCIVVLYDADEHTQPDRTIHKQIEEICGRFSGEVIPLVAYDELEAWLLADDKLRKWLGIKPRNWDYKKRPSAELKRLLMDKKHIKYQVRYRDEVLKHLDGTCVERSPSLKDVFKRLKDAPCVKS
jgi:hypothetical protein